MRNGMMGGIVVCCLFVIPFSVCSSDLALFVNDARVSLPSAPIVDSESILVPLEEFGPLIGIDVARSADAQEFTLRWSQRRVTFGVDLFSLQQGVHYAWLSWLVGLVDGAMHRVGDAVYVETERAALREMAADEEQIVLRFNRYAPDTLTRSEDGEEVSIRISNCDSDLAPQLILLGGDGFESVRVPASGRNELDVTVRLVEASALRVVRHEAAGYYSLTLRTATSEENESIIEVGAGTTLHELTTRFGSSMVHADFLAIDAWRSRYRMLPAYPTTGLGSGARIDAIARETGADLAIGVVPYGETLHVLVVDGVPLVVDAAEQNVFSVDLFGRWDVTTTSLTVCAQHAGARIAIDDVNRPIEYGEAVAYPPGDSGTLVRGIPGSFRAIKVRSDRVVSVYEGPFVSGDSTATMIVASGEAKARFSLIELGDPIALVCEWSAGERAIVHAFDTGPQLLADGVIDALVSSDVRGCTVLATDWHGGMVLLSLTCDVSEGTTDVTDTILAVLNRLDAPVRNAVVLSSRGASALAVRNAYDFDR
ncbi:hypothetical protein KJ567_05930, partial [Candidatus Bipolaricaulota bacterium]|nr:hypothetical protein [Candidatus Bipolaricaulota bacterium]